jgi:aminopeptidase S
VEDDPLTFIIVSQPEYGDLTGDAPDLVYTPDPGYVGGDSFTFKVNDGALDSDVVTVDITVNSAGPVTVFFDDFETNKGWIVNPDGTDTATAGIWERAVPATVDLSGPKQLAAYSGSYDLVTGPDPLRSWWWWTWSVDDINNGVTSVRSPNIALPSANQLTLSFMYYLAHDANSSADDFLRVRVIGASSQVLLEEFGGGNDDDAEWAPFSVDLSAFAGQTVYLLFDAADWGANSLVEAAIDDVLIIAE